MSHIAYALTLIASTVYKVVAGNNTGNAEIQAAADQRRHANKTAVKTKIAEILEADVGSKVEMTLTCPSNCIGAVGTKPGCQCNGISVRALQQSEPLFKLLVSKSAAFKKTITQAYISGSRGYLL